MKVLTIGTFDILHEGHINLFKACRSLAGVDGKVIVGVNTDEFVKKYRKKLPVLSLRNRGEVIHYCRLVDIVRPNYSAGRELIAQVEPDILVIGTDWMDRDYYKQINVSRTLLDLWKIQLVYVPYTEGISSTEIRKRAGGKR